MWPWNKASVAKLSFTKLHNIQKEYKFRRNQKATQHLGMNRTASAALVFPEVEECRRQEKTYESHIQRGLQKLHWGFDFNHNVRQKNRHLDTWIKICYMKWKEWHRNKGRAKCVRSFNLQCKFPPSLAVKVPRCGANETPLSGYSSWKAEHENMKYCRASV